MHSRSDLHYETGLSCVDVDGVETCRYTVVLANTSLFAARNATNSDRTAVASGSHEIRFGRARRKAARVLFQNGKYLPRNTNPEILVISDNAGDSCILNSSLSCAGSSSASW
jgi:hypothetical protein